MNKLNTIEGVYDGLLESVRRVDNFPKAVKVGKQEQVVYKLMHKDTGLFFEPKGFQGNVSELGKVFSNRKPPRQNFISIPYELRDKYPDDSKKTKHEDWIVVEYTLTEIKRGV